MRRIRVVGIGEDGWDGLSPEATHALLGADVVVGGPRQLALVAPHVRATEAWPSPMTPAVSTLFERHGGQIAVVASGDPLFYGVGSVLVATFGREAVEVIPHVSSVTLACARLGWASADVDVVSAVGRPLSTLHPLLGSGRRVLVLVATPDAATLVTDLLRRRGFGASAVTVLERLGGPSERIGPPDGEHDPLAIVAIDCVGTGLSRGPGLPDETYFTDGAMTKREVRALTLSALAPQAGELLWDVGAGTGSVAIEWMRTHRDCRALAIEDREDRRERIRLNADALGVPGLVVIAGRAPTALAELTDPDAVFVGGGLLTEGVIDVCLATGARIVANAVTIDTEQALIDLYARLGGSLTRLTVSRASSLGGFSAFRPALPITQWSYRP